MSIMIDSSQHDSEFPPNSMRDKPLHNWFGTKHHIPEQLDAGTSQHLTTSSNARISPTNFPPPKSSLKHTYNTKVDSAKKVRFDESLNQVMVIPARPSPEIPPWSWIDKENIGVLVLAITITIVTISIATDILN